MAEETEVRPPEPAAPPPEPQQGSLESRMGRAVEAQPAALPQPPVTSPAPVTTEPAQPGSEWQSIRDYAKEQGMELPWADDHAAVQNLLQSYRQLQERNYYADLGRQVAPHAEDVRAWIAQRQAPAAAAPPPAYRPPPFKQEWLAMVERDPETGTLRSKPGYDPALPEKVQAYSDWRDRFMQEPEAILGPLVDERARQYVQQEVSQYREQDLAQRLIQREATWIFQGGSVGGALTPAGRLYGQVVGSLYQGGLRDVAQLHTAAIAHVQAAVFRAQHVQAAAQPPAAPAAAAEVPVSLGGALARPSSSAPRRPATADPMKGLSLRERLSRRFDQTGVPENIGF